MHGKELSYNNLLDLDGAGHCSRAERSGGRRHQAQQSLRSRSGRQSGRSDAAGLGGRPGQLAFGSVLGLNRPVDAATAEVLVQPGQFIEAVVAPGFDPAAIEILTTRPKWKANVRLLELGTLASGKPSWDYRRVSGGLLVQTADSLPDPEAEWQVVTKTAPSDAQWVELRFAWNLVRHVKSNAIVLSKDRALCGVGAGQMSRVDSVNIAIQKAGPRAAGSVLGSDAFFPFADSIELAAKAGVAAFIQPGGSRNDEEVIAACNQHGLPMIFTGRRHFKH